MLWATPGFFWWLLAAVPLLTLFLIRMRPRRQVVSSLLFWDQSVPEGKAVLWLHRWRDRLMFLIQLLFLLLLVLALAEPRWVNVATEAEDLLLIVDNSASMQAEVDGVSRWQESLRTADEFLARLSSSSRVTLARTAPTNDAHWPRGRISPAAARQIVKRWKPSDVPGSIELPLVASTRSSESVSDVPSDNEASRQRVVIVTDAGTQQQYASADREDVEWLLVGKPTANTGLTQFQVRRSFADPLSFEIWAEVSHFSDQPLETTLEISLDDSLLDVVPLRLEPNEVWRHSWSHYSASGGPIRARLVGHDAFPLDNQAFAWLPPRPPREVMLVTTGSLYLETVLRAIPWVKLEVRREVPTEATWPADQLVIVHRMPMNIPPRGHLMMVDLRSPNALGTVSDEGFDTVVAKQAGSHWLDHVQLLDQVVSGVRSLDWNEPPTQELLESAEGIPIYSLVEHRYGRTLLLNLDLEKSDLAWRTAFPLLMVQAIQGLYPDEADFHAAVPAGQMASLPDRASTAGRHGDLASSESLSWTLVSPSGARRPLVKVDEAWQCGELTEIGLWAVEPTVGTVTRLGDVSVPDDEKSGGLFAPIACNLASADESELRWKLDPTDDSVSRSVGQTSSLPRDMYPMLLMLAMTILLCEWFLYQRRWIGG